MLSLQPGTRVRVSGLVSKPELNGKTGTISDFDEKTGRFAVRMLVAGEDGTGQSASVLIKPERLEPIIDAAYDIKGAAALDSASGREKLEVFMRHSSELHALKTEAASHSAKVAAAQSRDDLEDDVWDRVCDIQRLVQASTNACSVSRKMSRSADISPATMMTSCLKRPPSASALHHLRFSA